MQSTTLNDHVRKSYIKIGEIYFWTATINKWQHLLQHDDYKFIIINSLKFLSDRQLIDLFSYVIMPNHIHLIWRMNSMNGKESPHVSFLKFTAHEFQKLILKDPRINLGKYKVIAKNKKHEFWKRDSLAVRLYSKNIALQKMNYIHNNPIVEKWSFVDEPAKYRFSSAAFYENDYDEFNFLKHLMDEM